MTYGKLSPWTDKRVELLKKLWGEKLSSRKIGLHLGLSHTAVIGKAHRLGLSEPRKPPSPRPAKPLIDGNTARNGLRAAVASNKAARKTDHSPARTIKPDPIEPPFARDAILDKWRWPALRSKHQVTFWDHGSSQCKWPNDGSVLDGTFRFCGAPALSGCVYCGTHERMSRPGWRAA